VGIVGHISAFYILGAWVAASLIAAPLVGRLLSQSIHERVERPVRQHPSAEAVKRRFGQKPANGVSPAPGHL
jgi:hypothetical protein